MQYLGHTCTKKASLFIWNSSLAGCPVLYIATRHTIAGKSENESQGRRWHATPTLPHSRGDVEEEEHRIYQPAIWPTQAAAPPGEMSERAKGSSSPSPYSHKCCLRTAHMQWNATERLKVKGFPDDWQWCTLNCFLPDAYWNGWRKNTEKSILVYKPGRSPDHMLEAFKWDICWESPPSEALASVLGLASSLWNHGSLSGRESLYHGIQQMLHVGDFFFFLRKGHEIFVGLAAP